MIHSLFEKKEKKVEYIELIYDLIFVYVIGRNNALLHHIENGFVPWTDFLTYAVCTLAIIQIWNYTTYYINAYGDNSARDHVFMFINMFLLYFMAEGTRREWADYHTQYHIAWALILLNVGAQYAIELRHHRDDPVHKRRIVRIMTIIFIEAAIVLLAILEFELWGTSYCSCAAIVFGLIAIALSGRNSCSAVIDFEHLSERAMLYVVFTFGEMIIAIAGYFEGGFSFNNLYFSLMAFLIVVGLFLGYGAVYDRIVDRSLKTNGLGYMFLHVFIIFALNNITTALEFMREEEVALMPKVLFITGSMVVYFFFLFATSRYAKKKVSLHKRFFLTMAGITAAFVALMLLLRENMMVNIAVSAAYVFAVFFILRYYGIHAEREAES